MNRRRRVARTLAWCLFSAAAAACGGRSELADVLSLGGGGGVRPNGEDDGGLTGPGQDPDAGVDACEAVCSGRACGATDGCGNPCQTGMCAASEVCVQGTCTCDPTTCGGCCGGGLCIEDKDSPLCTSSPPSKGPTSGGHTPVPVELILLYGGQTGTMSFVGDTWVFDGTAWGELAVSGPPAREGAGVGTINGNPVLFGGNNPKPFSDTWTWSASTWSQDMPRSTSPTPPARSDAAVAALNGKILIFGGQYNGFPLGDTWVWDGSTWTQIMASNGPSERAGAVATTLGGTIVLFGGQNYGAPLGDTWTWDGSSWTLAATEGPDGRFDAAMGTLDSEAVLFGGQNYMDLNDTWLWDGTSWTEAMIPMTSMMPAPRTGAAVTQLNGKLILFGGEGVDQATWSWDGDSWAQLTAMGPSARWGEILTTFTSYR